MRILSIIALALMVITGSSSVQAQAPDADKRKAAEAHFKQGRAYYDAGDMDRAIEQYEKANALVPHPVNDFNIALAHRAKGEKRKALARFKRYLELDPKGNRSDEASTYIAELEPVIEAEDAELARQEAERKRLEAERAEAERQRKEAERIAAEKQAAIDAERRRNAEAAASERAARETRTLRWVGLGTATAGVISLGLGTYFGLKAKGYDDEINNADTEWNDELLGLWDKGESAEKKMFIFTGVGAAMTVAGGVVWYLGHRKQGAMERDLSIVPTASPGKAGVSLIGRF